MAKTLRTLSDPDFTMKGNTLTWSELDTNFIDLHNQMTDGSFDLSVNTLDVTDASTTLVNLGLSTNLADLTDAEAAQLENIGSVTISNTQWGYLGAMDQGVATSDSPDFTSLDIGGTEVIDSSRNASFVGGTFTGDVDISSTSVLHQLEIDTPTSDTNTNTNINFLRDSVTQAFIGVDRDSAGGLLSALTAGNDFVIRSQNGGVAIATNGNNLNSYFHPGGGLSIGTLSFSGSEKLRVAGDIRADESIIADSTSATWPRFDLSDNGTVKFSLRYELTGNKFALLSFDDGSGSLGNIIEIPYPGNDVHFLGDIQTDNFSLTTDFSGTGWQGKYAGDFNIRNLIVRESARFRELIIDQLATIAGSDLRSVARGKIESVNSGSNQITLEDPNATGSTRFAVNDFFWVKAIDIDNSSVIDLKGQITAISGVTLTLDTTVSGGTHDGGTTDISSLSAGDVIVQRGHPSTANRQSLIYTTVSDSDAPVQKYLTDIDSLADFDTASNISVAIGNLDNAPDLSDGTTPSGLGFYASGNAFLEGTIVGGGGNAVIDSSGLNLAYNTSTTSYVTWGSSDAYIGLINTDDLGIVVAEPTGAISLFPGGGTAIFRALSEYIEINVQDSAPSGTPGSGFVRIWAEEIALNEFELNVKFPDGTTKIIADTS